MSCYIKDSHGGFVTERTPFLSDPRIKEILDRNSAELALNKERRQQKEEEVVWKTPVSLGLNLVSDSIEDRLRLVESERETNRLRRTLAQVQQESRETELRIEKAKASEQRTAAKKLAKQKASLARQEQVVQQLRGQLDAKAARQEKLAGELNAKASRLSSRKRELDQREQAEKARAAQRLQQAGAQIEGLAAAFEVAGGEVVRRWRRSEFDQARQAVTEARSVLQTGDLATAEVMAERARAELTDVEERAFEDQRREDERKRAAGILIAALRKVGYQRVCARMRNPSDPRSLVDVLGELPSGKAVIFTFRHGGVTEIRQKGVSGHQECHSVEDAITAVTRGMGLSFGDGHHLAASDKRLAAPWITAQTDTRRRLSI